MVNVDEIIVDKNPEIKEYRAEEGMLIVERTHEKPVVHRDIHLVSDAEAGVAKIDAVIALWGHKRQRFQDIINKYNEIKHQPK